MRAVQDAIKPSVVVPPHGLSAEKPCAMAAGAHAAAESAAQTQARMTVMRAARILPLSHRVACLISRTGETDVARSLVAAAVPTVQTGGG